jgi:hypothetical protein
LLDGSNIASSVLSPMSGLLSVVGHPSGGESLVRGLRGYPQCLTNLRPGLSLFDRPGYRDPLETGSETPQGNDGSQGLLRILRAGYLFKVGHASTRSS